MGNYILGPNGEFVSADVLCHYGIKGMKWGVRRYQNKDGSLTPAGKKRYLDEDGALTTSGRKQMKKLNELDQYTNYASSYSNQAKANIERFSKRKDIISKLLANTNSMYVSRLDKNIERYDAEIKRIINDMREQKVDVVVRYNPYSDSMYYKQSDKQQIDAKDSRLYRKEGIRVARDDQYRITSAKAENADAKTIKRVNEIVRKGYY